MEEYAYGATHPLPNILINIRSDVIVRDELLKDLEESQNYTELSKDKKHRTIRKKQGGGREMNIDIHLKQAVLKEMENHDFAIIFPRAFQRRIGGHLRLWSQKKAGYLHGARFANS